MKKIICLFLVLAMVLVLFVSCGDDGKKKKKRDSVTETASQTESPITEDDQEVAEVNARIAELAETGTFDGESFRYKGRESENFPSAEEETGDIQNDAVYFRQRDIEDTFHLDFVNIVDENGDYTTQEVQTSVLAGEDAYDLVFGSAVTVGQYLLQQNLLLDFHDFEDIDFSRNWWMKSNDEKYTIGGRLFIACGPIVCDFYENSKCMIFNKTVQTDFRVEDLYSLVTGGEWTIDKMVEIASVIPAGSGKFRYGSSIDNPGVEWIFATGGTITTFDENGIPHVPDTLSQELSDLADRMSSILGDDTQCANLKSIAGKQEDAETKYGYDSLGQMFTENTTLFWFVSTGDIAGLREEDVEFGVLPYPKKDVSQSQYYTFANQWGGGAVFIPKTITNHSKVGVITEAMAALGYKYIKPAFYDKMLKGRSVYDFESREMVDLIFETTTYDIIDLFSGGDRNTWGEYMTMLTRTIGYDSSSLASSYASIAKMQNRTIERAAKKVLDSN